MSHLRTVAILALVLFVGMPAASVAFADAGTVHTIENESITVTTDSWTSVDDGSAPYLNNETVHYNGSTVSGSDYTWNTSDGTIQATGGDLAANAPADATITYSWRAQSDWVEGASQSLIVVWVVIAALLVFAGAMFAVNAMGSYRSSGRGGR